MGLPRPFFISSMPEINVLVTAPMPGSNTPSFPLAGATETALLFIDISEKRKFYALSIHDASLFFMAKIETVRILNEVFARDLMGMVTGPAGRPKKRILRFVTPLFHGGPDVHLFSAQ